MTKAVEIVEIVDHLLSFKQVSQAGRDLDFWDAVNACQQRDIPHWQIQAAEFGYEHHKSRPIDLTSLIPAA